MLRATACIGGVRGSKFGSKDCRYSSAASLRCGCSRADSGFGQPEEGRLRAYDEMGFNAFVVFNRADHHARGRSNIRVKTLRGIEWCTAINSNSTEPAEFVNTDGSDAASLNVYIAGVERIRFDESTTWLYVVTHQGRKDLIRDDRILDLDAKQPAYGRIHRGFP